MSSETKNSGVLRRRQMIVISPHADDAAYSIGGVIQKSTFKSQTHIITLFGRSNYLCKSGFERDWRPVTRLRKREDMTFATRIGAELTYLDFPEAALRTGGVWENVFTNEINAAVTIPDKLRTTVGRLIDRLRPRCLFAPLGIGGHRDHIIARHLATTEARERKLTVFYYEDLPYVADFSSAELFEHAKAIDHKLRPTCVPIDLPAKLNNLTLYRSQLGVAEMRIVAACTARLRDDQPAERLWSAASQPEVLRILQPSRALL